MSNFRRDKYNPKDIIKQFWPNADSSHITYNPDLKDSQRDYWVRRETGHDGTLYFTYEMFQKALIELMNKHSYCSSRPPEFEKVKDIKYTLGPMKHSVVFGQIKLKCSEEDFYPGQQE